jgi:hypothetical protein
MKVPARHTVDRQAKGMRQIRQVVLGQVDDVRIRHAVPDVWERIPGLHVRLEGQLPSGKNAQGMRYEKAKTVWDRPSMWKHPKTRFVRWRADAEKQMQLQLGRWKSLLPLNVPLMMYVWYWPGDRLIRDRSGMLDALFHLLERTGVIVNDGLIEDPIWRTMPMDRTAPRVHLTRCAASPAVQGGEG